MDRYDAIVVGARPAGAATAMLLARRGHRVLVLDRAQRGTDTLSTHALMRAGVLQLERWGLLPAILDAGTPPVDRVIFNYGTRTVPIPLRQPLYAPRRTVLDPVIAEAAVAAGADVRYRAHVTGTLRDADGRVAGVTWSDAGGGASAATADIVVGADGRNSLIARDVGAAAVSTGRRSGAAIYAYYEGVPTEGYHWSFVPGSMIGLVPTNDDLTVVFAMVSTHRFLHRLRRDLDGAIPGVLAGHAQDLRDRVAVGQQITRPRGFPGTPGWLRCPHGPGWALVGDAGSFKDPSTAHGLSDALRDAEYLARAIDAGLRGRQPMARALHDYERTRDALASDILQGSDAIAGFDWTLDEVQRLHLGISRAMQREVAALSSLPAAQRPVLSAA